MLKRLRQYFNDLLQPTRPELLAALVNTFLVLLVPLTLYGAAALAFNASNVARARVSTNFEFLLSTIFKISLLMTPFVALAIVSGWRTLVHARQYRERGGGWQGVVEAGALGLLIALLVLAPGIVTRPRDAPPYVVVYGGAALLIGLVVGVVLRFTAILVMRLASRAT